MIPKARSQNPASLLPTTAGKVSPASNFLEKIEDLALMLLSGQVSCLMQVADSPDTVLDIHHLLRAETDHGLVVDLRPESVVDHPSTHWA